MNESTAADLSLSAKRALITGGATGIGAAIAIEMARRGADVAITYNRHDPEPVLEEIRRSGRRGFAFAVDAMDSEAVEETTRAAANRLGSIDILVHNAGGLVRRVSAESATDEHWHTVLDLNLSSAFYFVRASLAFMGEGARVIFISSLAARSGGGEGAFTYSAAKAGLHGLTRALAKEVGARSITVNAVAPGLILGTPFHAEHTPESAQRATVRETPLGRAGTAGDVAGAVLFLASPNGSFCTGLILDVNGGTRFS